MKNKKLLSIILIVIVYFVGTGLSYLFFSAQAGSNLVNSPVAVQKNANGQAMFDETLPKTQTCPLNGAKYSKQQEAWWKKHGPLGVMIENHEEARPQSGLSGADVVYEAVAEGGITRFLAMFYCQDIGIVGPVRSARTYFIDFASEYGDFPLYAHVGGANQPGPADALGQISDYGWDGYNDLNQFSIGFPVFWRDYTRLGHEVATEHTMYSSVDKLWDYAAKTRKLTNKDKDGNSWDKTFEPYAFKDDASVSDRPLAQSIDVQFWEGYKAYFVNWKYDPKTNTYLRFNGGVPHLDKDTGKQIAPKTVVVLSMVELNANDGYENNLHLLYKNKGTGKATVFMDGKKIAATWEKDDRTSRTIIKDNSGTPIKFDRGLIWFQVLPTDGVLTVK
jgi:hypothetical protein